MADILKWSVVGAVVWVLFRIAKRGSGSYSVGNISNPVSLSNFNGPGAGGVTNYYSNYDFGAAKAGGAFTPSVGYGVNTSEQ